MGIVFVQAWCVRAGGFSQKFNRLSLPPLDCITRFVDVSRVKAYQLSKHDYSYTLAAVLSSRRLLPHVHNMLAHGLLASFSLPRAFRPVTFRLVRCPCLGAKQPQKLNLSTTKPPHVRCLTSATFIVDAQIYLRRCFQVCHRIKDVRSSFAIGALVLQRVHIASQLRINALLATAVCRSMFLQMFTVTVPYSCDDPSTSHHVTSHVTQLTSRVRASTSASKLPCPSPSPQPRNTTQDQAQQNHKHRQTAGAPSLWEPTTEVSPSSVDLIHTLLRAQTFPRYQPSTTFQKREGSASPIRAAVRKPQAYTCMHERFYAVARPLGTSAPPPTAAAAAAIDSSCYRYERHREVVGGGGGEWIPRWRTHAATSRLHAGFALLLGRGRITPDAHNADVGAYPRRRGF
jgi:hypothetical protein